MEVTARAPLSKRFIDLTGTTTRHGLRINSFLGFDRQYSVWDCICPHCGDHFPLRKVSINVQMSCGCIARCSNLPRRYFRAYWKKTIRKDCHPAWNTFEQFWSDVGCRLKKHERVYCANSNYRIGPDNFIIADGRVMGNCGPRTRLFFAAGEYWTVKRMADFFGCSRQNITQRLAVPIGGLRLKNEIELRMLCDELKESR